MSSPFGDEKTSGISTVVIAILAVVVIVGLGAGVFVVLPQLSTSAPTQVSTPTAQSKPPQAESSQVGIGDLKTCKGFIHLDEVKRATGRDDIEFIKARPNDALKDDPTVVSVCSAHLRTTGVTKSIQIVVIKMVSSDASISFVDRTVQRTEIQTPLAEITRDVVGDYSARFVINSEPLDSLVVFQSGIYNISLFTIVRPGESPLVTPDQLLDFAKIVNTRLP